MSTISLRTKQCLAGLKRLSELLEDSSTSFDLDLSAEEAVGELGRLRIWAGNIGAQQDGHLPTSLHYRLRDAPKLITRILDILEDVEESIEDGMSPSPKHLYSLASRTWVLEFWETLDKVQAKNSLQNISTEQVMYFEQMHCR